MTVLLFVLSVVLSAGLLKGRLLRMTVLLFVTTAPSFFIGAGLGRHGRIGFVICS